MRLELKTRVVYGFFRAIRAAPSPAGLSKAYAKPPRKDTCEEITDSEPIPTADIEALKTDRAVLTTDRAVLTTDRVVLMKYRAVLTTDRTVLMTDRAVLMTDRAVLTTDRAVLTADRAALMKDRAILTIYRAVPISKKIKRQKTGEECVDFF